MATYVDRPLTSTATGKVRATDLLPGVYPAMTSLTLIFPASNAGRVGVGDITMSALPADAYNPGENTTYPMAPIQNMWDLSQIYFWFENVGDIVQVRGNALA